MHGDKTHSGLSCYVQAFLLLESLPCNRQLPQAVLYNVYLTADGAASIEVSQFQDLLALHFHFYLISKYTVLTALFRPLSNTIGTRQECGVTCSPLKIKIIKDNQMIFSKSQGLVNGGAFRLGFRRSFITHRVKDLLTYTLRIWLSKPEIPLWSLRI